VGLLELRVVRVELEVRSRVEIEAFVRVGIGEVRESRGPECTWRKASGACRRSPEGEALVLVMLEDRWPATSRPAEPPAQAVAMIAIAIGPAAMKPIRSGRRPRGVSSGGLLSRII
jgi:hypothetical protein